jgi:hypothetical protein
MNGDDFFQILDGYTEDRGDYMTVIVWCAWCQRWHTHGYDPADGADAGHRAAHCHRPLSPYSRDGGYRIRVAGAAADLPGYQR